MSPALGHRKKGVPVAFLLLQRILPPHGLETLLREPSSWNMERKASHSVSYYLGMQFQLDVTIGYIIVVGAPIFQLLGVTTMVIITLW